MSEVATRTFSTWEVLATCGEKLLSQLDHNGKPLVQCDWDFFVAALVEHAHLCDERVLPAFESIRAREW